MTRALIPAAGHIILMHGTHICLIKRSIDVSWPLQWALPWGKVENDELLTEAAIRETQEETGVIVDPSEIEKHLIVNARYANGTRLYYFGVCNNWVGTPENIEPIKHDDINWFDLSELPKDLAPHHRIALELLMRGWTYAEFDVNL